MEGVKRRREALINARGRFYEDARRSGSTGDESNAYWARCEADLPRFAGGFDRNRSARDDGVYDRLSRPRLHGVPCRTRPRSTGDSLLARTR